MAGCTIYLVRHGQTVWNERHIIQGQSDSPLTPLGERQARELACALRAVRLDAVFSSDLGRARETAGIIAREHGLPVQSTTLLRERRFGRWEGQPAAALPRRDDLFAGMSQEERSRFRSSPDMESDEDMVRRLLRFLRETAASCACRTVLAVTHGGLMRAFLIDVGFGTYESFGHVPIGNAAYIKLLANGEELVVTETHGIAETGEAGRETDDETVQPPSGS